MSPSTTTPNTKLSRQLCRLAIVLGMGLQAQARFDVEVFDKTIYAQNPNFIARKSGDSWKDAAFWGGVRTVVKTEQWGDWSACQNGKHWNPTQCLRYKYSKVSFDVPYHDGIRVDAYPSTDNHWDVFYAGGDGTKIGQCEYAPLGCINGAVMFFTAAWCYRLMWCQIDTLE